jgi:hypothetical protein
MAANALPLIAVLWMGWDVFPVVLLYWLENVVVGAFNVLRMVWARPDDIGRWIGKLFLIPFFVFHYGMFTAIHGIFVFALFGGPGSVESFSPSVAMVWQALAEHGVVLIAGALVLSHGFSFAWNYLGRREYRRATLEALMHQPYARVIVLHITIIAGGFVILSLGSPVTGLVLLVALKSTVDVKAHLKERRKFASESVSR